MKNAFQYIHEILSLLDKDRRKIPKMVVLFLGVSMLDLIGLELIVPYIALVIQPDSIMEEGRIKEIFILLDLSYDREKLLLWLSLFGILISGQDYCSAKCQQHHYSLCTAPAWFDFARI